MSKDDARQQFLRILRSLPYGNSVFFGVRKIDDPIGLLPGRIILGINKRGVGHNSFNTFVPLHYQWIRTKAKSDQFINFIM